MQQQQQLQLQQPQLQEDAAFTYSAEQQQQQQQQHAQAHLHEHQDSQQHDRLSDAQLKPALQQLLQQMQDAHSSVQQHQRHHQQQQDGLDLTALQQQELTAVAQLTEMIQRLQHPKQLLTVLLVGRGALNVVHLTSAAGVLVRLAQQTQLMQQDPAFRTKVGVSSRLCEVYKLWCLLSVQLCLMQLQPDQSKHTLCGSRLLSSHDIFS
jgi:hypothetical protein